MEKVLSEFESILDSLEGVEELDGEELAFINTKWNLSVAHLREITAQNRSSSVKDGLALQQRLKDIIARTSSTTGHLIVHKSEVATQLFNETRRVGTMRQGGGYDVLARRPQLINRRA